MTNSKPQLTVAIDMDGTVYDLDTPWLAYIRDVLGEDISGGLTNWAIEEQYPKSGMKVYDFLHQEGMFFNLRPLPGAVEAINIVHESYPNVRQIFVTHCTTRTGAWEKQLAIRLDFPALADSVLVTSGRKDCIAADVLIDDGPHNLTAFPGITVKVPHKYNEETPSDYVLDSWGQYQMTVGMIAMKLGRELY